MQSLTCVHKSRDNENVMAVEKVKPELEKKKLPEK